MATATAGGEGLARIRLPEARLVTAAPSAGQYHADDVASAAAIVGGTGVGVVGSDPRPGPAPAARGVPTRPGPPAAPAGPAPAPAGASTAPAAASTSAGSSSVH